MRELGRHAEAEPAEQRDERDGGPAGASRRQAAQRAGQHEAERAKHDHVRKVVALAAEPGGIGRGREGDDGDDGERDRGGDRDVAAQGSDHDGIRLWRISDGGTG